MAKQNRTSDDSNTANGEIMSMGEESTELAASFVQQVDKSWMEGVDIERIVPLEPGLGVRGVLLGKGGPVDVTDPATGEVRPLDTWRIKVAARVTVRLLDSARLRSDLGNKPADGSVRVRIARLGSVKSKRGMNVSDFFIAFEDPSFRFDWEKGGAKGGAQ